MSPTTIQLKFFASLTPFSPDNAAKFPISQGTSVKQLLQQLNVPVEKVHLIFINSVRKALDTPLNGGDRVGIFPPVAGG